MFLITVLTICVTSVSVSPTVREGKILSPGLERRMRSPNQQEVPLPVAVVQAEKAPMVESLVDAHTNLRKSALPQPRLQFAFLMAVSLLFPLTIHLNRKGLLPSIYLDKTNEMIVYGVAYSFCAIIMTVSNKIVIQGSPVLLAAIQMLFSVIALLSIWPALDIDRETVRNLNIWIPVPILFGLQLVSALQGLSEESISTWVMMTCLRPLYCCFFELTFFNERPTPLSISGCVLLVLGSLGYMRYNGGEQSHMSKEGIYILLFNGVVTVLHQCYMRYVLAERQIQASRGALLLTQNIGGLLFVGATPFLWTGEEHLLHERIREWFHGADLQDLNTVIISCLGGLAIGYAQLAFQKTVSASGFLATACGVKVLLVLIDHCLLGTLLPPMAEASLVVALTGSAVCIYGQTILTTQKEGKQMTL